MGFIETIGSYQAMFNHEIMIAFHPNIIDILDIFPFAHNHPASTTDHPQTVLNVAFHVDFLFSPVISAHLSIALSNESANIVSFFFYSVLIGFAILFPFSFIASLLDS